MFSNLGKKAGILLAAASTLAAFGFGFYFGKTQVSCKVCAPEKLDFSLFWEAWDVLHQNFVSPEKLDDQKLIYGAISGMVDAAKDPYTVFMSPEDTKMFMEDTTGRFEGVGMEVGIRKGSLQVVSPIKGTPAEKAGLRPGDRILKIDDAVTVDLSVDEAVSLIRGAKGTTVTLNIFRDDWDKPKDFPIVRAVIEIPSLEWELKDVGDGQKVAYIQLYQFTETADYDFITMARKISASSSQGIILDLRNDPGGYLEVAQDIAGWFLERGQIVTIEDRGTKITRKEYKAEGNSGLLSYPVVVLINQGSASASEILAGALRDNRGVKLIGETSFGKGSVQQLEKLTGGASLKITVAKWLTPNGSSISEKGLTPDIEVKRTEEDFIANRDPQLDKAIEIIKGLR